MRLGIFQINYYGVYRIRHKVASSEYMLQHAFVYLCKHCFFPHYQ